MKSEPAVLVCAPADAPRVVRGTVFCHKCARCGRRLMMAPSGQACLKRNPDLEIICCYCFTRDDAHTDHTEELAAPLEDILRESRTSMPNFWRRRH